MLCAIWYHLYNLKNVKNTHGGVLPHQKVTMIHGCFPRPPNCANGTKARNTPHIRLYATARSYSPPLGKRHDTVLKSHLNNFCYLKMSFSPQ